MLCWRINIADQGVHAIRRSAALLTMLAQVNYLILPPLIALNRKLYLFFNASFNSSIKAMEIALIDWIRKFKTNATIVENVRRGSYRGIPVMRDWLILFSVKREFNKLFFVIRDLKVLRDP